MDGIIGNSNSIYRLDIPAINCNFLSCTIEESSNRFLKTHKGLQYLLLKYPNLSLLDAIREYKIKEAEAEFYAP